MTPSKATNPNRRQAPRRVEERQIRKALEGVEFPADKSDLMEEAKAKDVPGAVVEAIQLLPEEDFESFDEVITAFDEMKDETAEVRRDRDEHDMAMISIKGE